jgi:hypothetical protein
MYFFCFQNQTNWIHVIRFGRTDWRTAITIRKCAKGPIEFDLSHLVKHAQGTYLPSFDWKEQSLRME